MIRLLRLFLSPLLIGGIFVLAGPAEEPGPAKVPMNLIVEMNCDLANAAARETRSSPEGVDEVIVGAKVDGHGISYTVSGVEFIPDEEKASLELVIRSRFDSETSGSKGPVVAFNCNQTYFHGRKPVWITCDGVSWDHAYVGVRNETQLQDIHVKPKGILGAIIRPLAYLGYERDKDKAREEGEYKGGVKFLANLDKESGEQLAEQNKSFHERLEKLEKRNVRGKPFLFRTTRELLIAMTRLAEENQPPAIAPPLAVQGLPALSVRVHESLLNTAGSRLYSGKTRDRAGFEQDMKDLGLDLDSDEEKPKKEEEKKPPEKFEITFTERDPILVSFANQLVRMTIRSRKLKRDDESYAEPWQITVTYRLSKTAKGFRLDREGDIEAVPLDKTTEKPLEDIPGPKIAERRAIIRLVRRSLDAEYTIDEYKPTGDLKKIGTLESDQAEASNGWLLLAWKRNPQGQ